MKWGKICNQRTLLRKPGQGAAQPEAWFLSGMVPLNSSPVLCATYIALNKELSWTEVVG